MVETGQDLGFGEVRFEIFGRGDALEVRHLDGNGAVELVVVGEVDSAEAAFAQQADYPVAADFYRVA